MTPAPPTATGAAPASGWWRPVELLHTLVYYAPERPAVYAALGFRGGWMAYFATRSAALGRVSPAAVTACFYGFAPRMVSRALPDAWEHATPEQALAARYEVFERAAERVLGAQTDGPPWVAAADTLTEVVQAAPPHAGVLFAAHAALPAPSSPLRRVFWAASALRELRGDSHVLALRTAGVSPVEANALMVALGLVPADQQRFRGWSDEEWGAGVESLTSRGWLDAAGAVTALGRRRRAEIEQETDRLCGDVWQRLDADRAASLARWLRPVVDAIVAGGAVPFPNGVGVPPADEPAAAR